MTPRGAISRATEEAGLLFLEQPFEPTDMKGLAALARTAPIAIGADEGIHSLHDIEAHAAAGAGGVSLKLIKLGGFGAALAAGALCKRLGLAVNIAAKMSESSLASAATVHLACAVENIDWGVSLTHFYLAEDIVRQPLAMTERAGVAAARRRARRRHRRGRSGASAHRLSSRRLDRGRAANMRFSAYADSLPTVITVLDLCLNSLKSATVGARGLLKAECPSPEISSGGTRECARTSSTGRLAP